MRFLIVSLLVLSPSAFAFTTTDPSATTPPLPPSTALPGDPQLAPMKMLVIRLRTVDVNTAAAAVDELLAEVRTRDERVQVQTDDRTNSVIISAPVSDLRRARALLRSLDQDGNSSAPFAPPQPVGK